MPLLQNLQPWLTGRGPCLQVAAFGPDTPPLRHWAAMVPWAALVAAVDGSFARRFPRRTTRGRPPVSTRVLVAVERLTQEVACSEAQICRRLRTDLAVMSACGITAVQGDGAQAPCVLPEVLAHCRRRVEAPLMAARLALQAATAMADGLVRPAHLVVAPVPSEPGSPRVHEAAPV
jgi:hypothetical protein